MAKYSLGSKKLLGVNFGTRISKGSGRVRDLGIYDAPSSRWILFTCLLVGFLLLLFGRLFDLQIIEGSYFRLLAEGNRIRRIPIKAPRGEILDRNGYKLAQNVPIYKLATFNSGGIVEKTEEVSREEALKIQEEGGDAASRLLIDSGREYPYKEVVAHVVGYVNEATVDEVSGMTNAKCQMTNEAIKYQLGDLVGRMGVEEQDDCQLRGVNGEDLIEVDARGRLVRRLGRKDPIPGKSITLGIDIDLQTTAYQAMLAAPNEKGTGPRRDDGEIVRGALVAENPQNGEVLALVSVPYFDPNNLKDNYAQIVKDPNLPFFDRAISGTYHPGSTFKIITSAAGLQDGKIDENYTYTDVGYIDLGGTRFRNWLFGRNGGAEGSINVVRALTRSTDTFFYTVGDLVGIDRLAFWADVLGVGKKTGIDLPGEVTGLMPNAQWKQNVKGERWYTGNTYNTAIGQGDVTTTPIQVAGYTSVIANRGKLCRPHVVTQIQNSKFKIQNENGECEDLNLKQETLQLIKAGMIGACSPGGTAGQFFNFQPRVACKTGTAQVGTDKTHAWFTAFAPVENPQIAVTAVIEEGGEGSIVAAPVVKKVYQKYFGE